MKAGLTDQAIRFLEERRWPMVPSTGTEKKPCVGWKEFQETLPTIDQLRQWGREFRPARWGLVTGALAGVVVADFDGDVGVALMQKWGIKPHLRTGSGGFHCHLQHPGWRVPTLNAKSNKGSWPWPGLDIRGDGGFAILLGRNSNGPYVQLRELDIESFDVLPEDVRDFLRAHSEQTEGQPKPPADARPEPGKRVDCESIISKALAMAPRDGRNNAGFWLTCQLRDNGYSQSEAEHATFNYHARVPSVNTKGKREAYTVAEIKASVREAYSKPPREPWARKPARAQLDRKLPEERRAPDSYAHPEEEDTITGHGADDPDILGIYVDHTGGPQVDHTGEPLPPWDYARIPREVACDADLKPLDVKVYCMLSGSVWQGNSARVGTRLIADCIHASRRLVIESLRRLEERGHIRKTAAHRGKRELYVLLSPVFGQKQRDGVEEVAIGPGGPRLVSAPRTARQR